VLCTRNLTAADAALLHRNLCSAVAAAPPERLYWTPRAAIRQQLARIRVLRFSGRPRAPRSRAPWPSNVQTTGALLGARIEPAPNGTGARVLHRFT
jgi:hypothetical protein